MVTRAITHTYVHIIYIHFILGKQMCCGYDDGSVKLLDLKSGSSVATLPGISEQDVAASSVGSGQVGHRGPVLSLCSSKDGSLVITGSTDGTSKLISATSGKVGKGWDELKTSSCLCASIVAI